ncbi:low-density lipoprotein receptor class A domain-containing protein 2 [Thalassophryne amazonica]|uniref:low-density lipoprotein receptor class A domain-containing protein 2 n=1 Tax=Thalassophryne amazonica TaxID=390379 RepID=UPI001471D1C2|nr:low-density lipoprotein receptor class A domain-containing protein 2 [Thalassophryne amazonica]
MIVNSHAESKKYYFVTMGTDCQITMQASSPKDKVQFYFRFFLVYSLLRVTPLDPTPLFPESPPSYVPLNPTLESGSGQFPGDPCHAGSFVQFYDGRDRSSPPLGLPLCGKSPPRPVLSTGNYLTLRLVTRGNQPRVDFVGDFTSFRLGFNQSQCSTEPYFICRNGKCIPVSLVCDEQGIDNCGDGSDLTSGCKADQPPRPDASPSVATPPHAVVKPSTGAVSPHVNCDVPDSTPRHKSVRDPPGSVTLLVLYVILGVAASAIVLCWCCWSPGWFLWRVSACRFLPYCNSACASCQFCARNSSTNKEHRVAKVTPHAPINGTPVSTAATNNSPEENVLPVAV